jgi:hypothetical protein
MKRILTTLSQKWPEYLLEILVLIIGIYGGFALDNWNESRKENNQEIKYLNSLKLDIETDLVNLDSMISDRKRKAYASIDLLELPTPKTEEEVRYYFKLIWDVFTWTSFTPRTNTMDELISTGNLSILSNDSIKYYLFSIKQLNEELVPRREHMRREYEHYLYDQIMGVHPVLVGVDYRSTLITNKRIEKAIPEDELRHTINGINLFLNDTQARNGLILAAANNGSIVDIYAGMRIARENLLRLIEVNLNQKQSNR